MHVVHDLNVLAILFHLIKQNKTKNESIFATHKMKGKKCATKKLVHFVLYKIAQNRENTAYVSSVNYFPTKISLFLLFFQLNANEIAIFFRSYFFFILYKMKTNLYLG